MRKLRHDTLTTCLTCTGRTVGTKVVWERGNWGCGEVSLFSRKEFRAEGQDRGDGELNRSRGGRGGVSDRKGWQQLRARPAAWLAVALFLRKKGGEAKRRDHRQAGKGPSSNPRLGSALFSPWFPDGCPLPHPTPPLAQRKCSDKALLVAVSQGPTQHPSFSASPRGTVIHRCGSW